MDIDWPTGVITVYKTDPFMTFAGGHVYNMDTEGFRRGLKDLEDDPVGMAFPDTHRHNTTSLLGGIEYARIIEILAPYTITFDDTGGGWVCNLIGSNNNILDRTNLTTVQVRSNNSAGLVQMSEIQYGTFNGGVTVDAINGVAGTLYPIGTPIRPCNNIADARAIAAFRGFTKIFIVGDLVLDTGDDVSGMMLMGNNASRTFVQIHPGAETTGVEIREVTMTGTLDGTTIIRDSSVFDLDYVSGFLFQCQLAGTITLGGVMPASIMQCFGGVNGVIVDMDGSGHALNVAGWNGDMTIANKAGNDPCVIHAVAASITLDSSVTNGSGIHIDGTGEFINNSVIAPDRMSIMSTADIAEAVLDAATATPIHANVRQMNDASVTGTGTSGDKWRGV